MNKNRSSRWTLKGKAYPVLAVALTIVFLLAVFYGVIAQVQRDRSPTYSIEKQSAKMVVKQGAAYYTDVDPAGAQADEINAATASGYVIGVGGMLYEPDRTPTRGEIAVVLVRCNRGPDFLPPPISAPTPDHPYAHWAAPWLAQAIADGQMDAVAMVMGDEPATRGDMAALVMACR